MLEKVRSDGRPRTSGAPLPGGRGRLGPGLWADDMGRSLGKVWIRSAPPRGLWGRVYHRTVPGRRRRARVEDVHAAAAAMPHVSVITGPAGNPVYQVGGKSFVFFRTPRPDALDPISGERFNDVIVLWVASEDDKQALVQDPTSPWFTTAHFDGHPPVLVRASRLGELDQGELVEVVQEAWVARASPRRAAAWLRSTGLD
jgi:hypothetical protein